MLTTLRVARERQTKSTRFGESLVDDQARREHTAFVEGHSLF
jgi:hypothetical protein